MVAEAFESDLEYLEDRSARLLDWSEVIVRRRVEPRIPRDTSEGSATCDVFFFIDERGHPYDIAVTGCAEPFATEAREAAWLWRFRPTRHDGERIKVQTLIRFRFELE